MAAGPMVTICDVGPRDGLQNEPTSSPPRYARSRRPARRCARPAGRGRELRRPPPCPADGRGGGGRERDRAEAERRLRGPRAERARVRAARRRRARRGPYAFGATESFDRRNQNASVEESLEAGLRIVERAGEDGLRVGITISVAFGCPFEGAVDEGRVLELAARVAEARPDTLLLADTIGVGVPRQVHRLVEGATKLDVPVGGHFHNTRNTGYATHRRSKPAQPSSTHRSAASAAVPSHRGRPGTSRPRTSSISSTARGSRPGSTLMRLVRVSEWLEGVLGRQLEGQVYRAGVFPPPVPG